jgi:hypothetical protein
MFRPAGPIIPMPHLADDDQTYDFVTSDGSRDGSYTDTGQPVVDLGFMVPEDYNGEEDESGYPDK